MKSTEQGRLPMTNILIIGATSAIAKATARIYAQQGAAIYLFARNQEQLETLAADLRVRGASKVFCGYMDVNDHQHHETCLQQAAETLGKIDIYLVAHGTLPNQKACERDPQLAMNEITTNGVSTVLVLTDIANRLENQKSGTLAVITSVAGDRGRQSNYVYGAAKGMVSIFLQGLRNRLHKSGVHVLDIKPGFVDTPMTAGFAKGILWANPEKVALDISRAIDKGKHTVYTPFFWWLVMFNIRSMPDAIFKRLRL